MEETKSSSSWYNGMLSAAGQKLIIGNSEISDPHCSYFVSTDQRLNHSQSYGKIKKIWVKAQYYGKYGIVGPDTINSIVKF